MFDSISKKSIKRATGLSIIITLLGGFLAILVAWKTLEFPVFATEKDIEKVEYKLNKELSDLTLAVQGMASFQKDTRSLLLNQDWWRIQAKIDSYKTQLSKNPDNIIIRDFIRELERQQEDTKSQIYKLLNKKP